MYFVVPIYVVDCHHLVGFRPSDEQLVRRVYKHHE
jgi:hypothetical protein